MSETTKPTLLVVEDETANIDMIIAAVGNDYNVCVETDGVAALISAKERLPDLILLDIMMPGIDGFEVCRRLKNDPALRDIPIIFLTALNQNADETRGLKLGAVDYITKPFKADIVKARVRNHMELKKYRDHLEALVAERTKELVQANGELANANKDLEKANERLVELGRVKDDFLGMISHELRTPANGMLGIGELIIDLCSASAECTLYSKLFRESSLRMRNLIEDATMIADIEKTPISGRAAISFSDLLDNVRASLKEISITLVREGIMEPVFLQGDPSLLKKAMETLIRLATAFSREKQKAQITGAVEALTVRVRLALDDLSLTEAQAADFFELESSARRSSTAEILGLAPVVADKIIAAFGGKISLVKGEGKTGYLEAVLIREQGRAEQQ